MIPAHTPHELVLQFPDAVTDESHPWPTSIFEYHPVVGWTDDANMDPLILHWKTGRATPVPVFLADRDPDRTEIRSVSFRATPHPAAAKGKKR